MPYRIDLASANDELIERLIDLGALDAQWSQDGSLAAVIPDTVAPEQLATVLGVRHVSVSDAQGRDDGSVWVVNVRPLRIGPRMLNLIDAPAFGTGLHPTTALCLDILAELARAAVPEAMLDVGTGSGVLALAALSLGVQRAVGADIDVEALAVAAENARINGFAGRLELIAGGPEAVVGSWTLVVANVLAAPLVEMAPALVRRIAPDGQLVLSGIASSLEQDVERAYCHLGMRRLHVRSRSGWTALVLQASW